MHADPTPADRPIAMSVREARMYVGRILLTCGLPSGAIHGATECILTSQSAGCGGFAALLRWHAELRIEAFGRLRVADVDSDGDAGTLAIDGGDVHAWIVIPALLDLAVDVARRQGAATLQVRGIRARDELRVLPHLARRHGAVVALSFNGATATVTAANGSPPRSAEQYDPLLLRALQRGYPVTESLWRDLHALSNRALARDSVVSRRHAGPVILLDDGTVVGRQPSDDDYDPDMLKSVSSSAASAAAISTPATPARSR
ncbi:MAG: hypothetical protein AB7G13_29970 [Lautropia sp.]